MQRAGNSATGRTHQPAAPLPVHAPTWTKVPGAGPKTGLTTIGLKRCDTMDRDEGPSGAHGPLCRHRAHRGNRPIHSTWTPRRVVQNAKACCWNHAHLCTLLRRTSSGSDAEHPDAAASLSNQAALLEARGDLAGAEPLYRRALAIREKSRGPDHPETAISLTNLAALLQARGDLAGAEPLYRRALAIREKALGPDHPDTATSLQNLAGLLQARGDLSGAEPLYCRAWAIRDKALGPDHPDTASSLNNLARVLQARGGLAGGESTAALPLGPGYLQMALGSPHITPPMQSPPIPLLQGDEPPAPSQPGVAAGAEDVGTAVPAHEDIRVRG